MENIFTPDTDEEARDVYYVTDRNGNGVYAQPINVEAILALPEEQLEQLKIKHEAIQIKLEKTPLEHRSHREGLDALNNFTTLQIINRGLNQYYFKQRKKSFLRGIR